MTDISPNSEDGAELGDFTAPPESSTMRPEHLPEVFWDATSGTLRADALAEAYLELEQKLGSLVSLPASDDAAGWDSVLNALGRPATPEEYRVSAPHPLLEPDMEVHSRLHAAGFTQKQVELVYELAAERLVPALQVGLADLEAERQRDRLERHFGSAEAWQATARQIRTWAAASLPADAVSTLSASSEGVIAMHKMMQASEPLLLGVGGEMSQAVTESGLNEMIRHPRYWRDHDPEFIARVSAGFRQLYGD